MLYYIDQSCTSSFRIGLVKTESDLIVRSVVTGLGRWMLVVAVISVDAYLFWLSQTWPVTLRIQEQVFSGCTVLPNNKETKLGISNQEASPLAGKKNQGSFSAMLCMEVCPYSCFQWFEYYWGPWVSFVTIDEFSVRVTKIPSRIGVSWTHSLPLFLTWF